MGFEIFDKPNWVGSEFDEQVNYQRALEGELEHTVGHARGCGIGAGSSGHAPRFALSRSGAAGQGFGGAEAAPSHAGRRRAGGDSQSGGLGGGRACPGRRWSLVDAAGHLPLGPKTAEAMRLTAEEALEEKLVDAGAGHRTGQRACLGDLDYDPTATDETQETYDPDQDRDAFHAAHRADHGPAGGGRRCSRHGERMRPTHRPCRSIRSRPRRRRRPKPSREPTALRRRCATVTENPGHSAPSDRGDRVNDRMTQPAARAKARSGSRARRTSCAI
jgi:flagellar M-ring protein FliF